MAADTYAYGSPNHGDANQRPTIADELVVHSKRWHERHVLSLISGVCILFFFIIVIMWVAVNQDEQGPGALDFDAQPSFNSTIHVTWTTPPSDSITINGYSLLYQALDDTNEYTELEPTVEEFWTPSLTPGVEYTFTIVCYSSAGSSPAAKASASPIPSAS